jgi:hypothetical protein
MQTYASKVMALVFWENDGMMLVEFLETGVRISSERYVQTFKKLKKPNEFEGFGQTGR